MSAELGRIQHEVAIQGGARPLHNVTRLAGSRMMTTVWEMSAYGTWLALREPRVEGAPGSSSTAPRYPRYRYSCTCLRIPTHNTALSVMHQICVYINYYSLVWLGAGHESPADHSTSTSVPFCTHHRSMAAIRPTASLSTQDLVHFHTV